MRDWFDSGDDALFEVQTTAAGASGALPFTDEMLRSRPSGDLFGWSQDAAMGWSAAELGRPEFLILSTMGGLRAATGRRWRWDITPGTGKSACWWRRRRAKSRPAAACRSPGSAAILAMGGRRARSGMFDSLAYRNDAAIVLAAADSLAADAARRARRGDLR